MATIGETLISLVRPPVILLTGFVGLITSLIFGNPAIVTIVCLFCFFGYGYLDSVHREAKAVFRERTEITQEEFPILMRTNIIENSYLTQALEEVEYGGFRFRLYHYNKGKMPPEEISYPLCPSCGSDLVEIARVKFPALVRISLFCPVCKVPHQSKYTRYELVEQAIQAFNVVAKPPRPPKPRRKPPQRNS